MRFVNSSDRVLSIPHKVTKTTRRVSTVGGARSREDVVVHEVDVRPGGLVTVDDSLRTNTKLRGMIAARDIRAYED